MTNKIEGTRIKKSLLNPNNYIWMKEGQVQDFEKKIQNMINQMLSSQEVQQDFDEFIKSVADTYRKLAQLIITEIVYRKNTGTQQEQMDIISKIYNVDFGNALKIID